MALSEDERIAAGDRFRAELEAEPNGDMKKSGVGKKRLAVSIIERRVKSDKLNCTNSKKTFGKSSTKKTTTNSIPTLQDDKVGSVPKNLNRTARRKNRGHRRKIYEPDFGNRRPIYLFWIGMAVLAVVIGLALVQS